MISECINDIGLILDIIGAVLLFKFGLPASIDREGRTHIIIEQVDDEEIKKGKFYDLWGRIGLGLLVLGFIFQLASNHVSS
jgi:hypothetical protein